MGLAFCCRQGGRSFLARTERPSGSTSPPFGGRATAARDTGDVCDGITSYWDGGPRKKCIEERVRWQKSHYLFPIMSASSPAYSRRASDRSEALALSSRAVRGAPRREFEAVKPPRKARSDGQRDRRSRTT